MLLTGTFKRTVDQKYRIAIPKRLRGPLIDGSEETSQGCLYIAPSTDGSLAIYSERSFSRLADKLSESSPTGQDVRAFSRMFYAQAQCVEMDSQGRVRIEPELVELAGLDKEVMLVGVGDRIELWDADRWQTYRTEQQARYDELAEKAFAGGGTPAKKRGDA